MSAVRRASSSAAWLPVVDVAAGRLRLSDGGLRAVLECPTLAFGIKGEPEQTAVIQGWAQLLNSLSHPIQILIRTRSLSAPSAFDSGQASTDPRAGLQASYEELLASLAERRQLVDRHFYVVVPWRPDPASSIRGWLKAPRSQRRPAQEQGADLLEQRVAWLSEALRRIDLEPVRLSSREIAALLQQALCPSSARVQPVPAEETIEDLADLVAPAAVAERPFDIEVDGRLAQTLAVSRYPSRIRPGWLESLLALEGDLDLSLHVQPAPGPVVMSFLERRLAELSSTVRVAEEQGRRVDPYRRAALEDAQELQDGLARGEERLFDVSLYLTAWADERQRLESLIGRVEAALGSQLIHSRRLLFQMEPALICSLPLALDRVGLSRSLSTSALAATFPFTGNDLRSDGGLLYGVNPTARTPVILDRFALENHNAVVFATSGAGKSYLVKVELLRAHLAGIRVQVIDPEGEYAGIVGELGGSVLQVRPGQPVAIDAFAVAGPGALDARIASLLTLIELVSGGLSPLQRAVLEDALSFLYATHRFVDDRDNRGLKPPTLFELHELLQRRSKEASDALGDELAQLVLKLNRYAKGAGSWLFKPVPARATPEGLRAYVLSGLPEEDRAPAMFIVLDHLWAALADNSEPALVLVDEAWWLMQYPDTARFLFRLAKTARKRKAGLTLVTQDVSDVLASPLGAAAVTNSALQVLMKQAPQAIEPLARLFRLTGAEQSWLLNARPGEGLLLAQGKRVPFQVLASQAEARLIEAAERGGRAA